MATTHPKFKQGFVLFDAQQQRYYTLDALAVTVWNLVQRPMTLREICDAIMERLGIEVMERDVATILEEMQTEGLIETT